jgi:arylsulfatase A-like enzyme
MWSSWNLGEEALMQLRLVALCCLLGLVLCTTSSAADRPNILWITAEDHGPHLGCYGDAYAITPNLDAFAQRGCRYTFCWSNCPVCAPARTTLITGMYAQSLGAEHMRSMVPVPDGFQLLPQHLRSAGYYCSNNVKEDYNVASIGQVWDESSNRAHWRKRGSDQPFFAVFNYTITHESQIRNRIDPADQVHDPAKARVPPYHPDTRRVRKDWAQYYDRLTMMDQQAGQLLRDLETDGLADDTIVFFFSDHGSGMPRSKRWLYDSGLHVPLLIHIPDRWRHLAPADYQPGGTSSRLVSFVDFAPTILSLCGVEIPQAYQGQAFLGPTAGEPRKYVFGARGRMDERIDMSRSVSDGRYVYIRNYFPHRPQGQYLEYMFQTPTTQVWKRMFDAGELNSAQSRFWQPKECEELYDLQTDPDEITNLTASTDFAPKLDELRTALVDQLAVIRDTGFLPEAARQQWAGDSSIYDFVRQEDFYAAKVWHSVAVHATDPTSPERDYFADAEAFLPLQDIALFWAATGALARGESGVRKFHSQLRSVLDGELSHAASPTTRIMAGEALGKFGDEDNLNASLSVLIEFADLQQHGVYVAQSALIALDELDARAAPLRDRIARLPREAPGVPARMETYVPRLLEKTLADLQPSDN